MHDKLMLEASACSEEPTVQETYLVDLDLLTAASTTIMYAK